MGYDGLLRYHSDMANLIVNSSEGNVPLPSHFDPDNFTVAAFDNFDHEKATLSGIQGTHDTVSVLFQDKPTQVKSKPNVSETSVEYGSKVFKQKLPCQNMKEFFKSSNKVELPADYSVADELFSMDAQSHAAVRKKDSAWTLSRLDHSEADTGVVKPCCSNQKMPSWSAFNSVITDEELVVKSVGFKIFHCTLLL